MGVAELGAERKLMSRYFGVPWGTHYVSTRFTHPMVWGPRRVAMGVAELGAERLLK
jgi:hypothetical protein